MNSSNTDINDDFFPDIRMSRKAAKKNILDETFKKAEMTIGLRPSKKKKFQKKTFQKLGIGLIVIGLVSIFAINYLPWMYVKFDTDYGTMQEVFNRDFKKGNFYDEIDYIFESPCTNCSNNSKSFIGLTKGDFSNIPKLTSYAFIILVLLGIIFTIFEVIERSRNLSVEIAKIIHSIFAVGALIVSVFVVFISIKILSSNLVLYYNKPFIEIFGIKNVILIFPAPIILIVISLVSIMISIFLIKINFHEFEKKFLSEKTRSTLSGYKFWS
jgi:hypothetical protein